MNTSTEPTLRGEYVSCTCGGSYPPGPFNARCPFCQAPLEPEWASAGRQTQGDNIPLRAETRVLAGDSLNGSDGTRTRDLRRDRPAL